MDILGPAADNPPTFSSHLKVEQKAMLEAGSKHPILTDIVVFFSASTA
jgi:hypothetical protein